MLKKIAKGYDIFMQCTALASIAMQLFRKRFLPSNQLAIIPENGKNIAATYNRSSPNYRL